jgi:hypothetical protein
MAEVKRTWYFVEPASKIHDLYNILHLPYTGMVLSFVLIGSSLSHNFYAVRVVFTVVAFFLGLGVGAHAVDQLEPNGSIYVRHLTRKELKIVASVSISIASVIGLYYAFKVNLLLIIFVLAGLFFSFAYPLPSYFFGGLFHNRPAFSFSWGYLPYLTGYFVNDQFLSYTVLLLGLPIAAVSWAELTWSRKARKARKEGLSEQFYAREEKKLKILVVSVYAVTLSILVARFLRDSVYLQL